MERREIEEIERFFAGLGHRTPLAYYGLAEDAADDAIDLALKKRRTWAQGQQANPKYRTEALFLIKSNASLRRLLLEERGLYAAHFGGGNAALAELDGVLQSALSGGWTAAAEATVRTAGRRLELDEGLVEARMQARARELGLARESEDDLGAAAGIDLYELLAVPASAGTPELEAAYRARYRWARSLKDKERAGRVLAALDAAWRIVQDPARRTAYDARRAELGDATEEVERTGRRLGELLGEAESEVGAPSPEQVAEVLRATSRAAAGEVAPPPPPPPLRLTPPTAPAGMPTPPRPAPASLPPELPPIAGRTIGLAAGPQMVRERAPRLVVPVKSPVRLTLPRSRSVRWPLTIKNSGQGRMPGRVTVDVPWIVPEREWIDPNPAEQELILELRPDLLQGNRGSGAVTVVTDHGERRTVQFEVERSNFVLPLVGVLFVSMLGAAAWYGFSWWQEANRPPPPAVLRLSIDPPASAVSVGGVVVGSGSSLQVVPPKRGEPFRLQVEREGFVPHEELITVDDRSFDRALRLELDGPLGWSGVGEPSALDASGLAPLAARGADFSSCYPESAGTLRLAVRVDARGAVLGLDLTGEGVDVEPGRDCVARIVRSTAVPPPAGAWGAGELTVPVGQR